LNPGTHIEKRDGLLPYGACVARQYFDHVNAGRGTPEDDIMKGILEEAEAVANYAQEISCQLD
jgi:hypothetical protein